jgi:hypothetical protein
MRARIRAMAVWLGAAVIMAAASAQGQGGGDRVVARALFDEARNMITAGKPAEACPKFEESQRLDPGTGTLFNLADCYERVGRTATAWLTFLDVASQMRTAGQTEKEQVARARAAALEPKLNRLKIEVPQASRIAGLDIKRDGLAVKEPSWGSALPVDSGEHVVEASAPGRKAWRTTLKVEGAGTTQNIEVPALDAEAAAAPTSSAAPAASAAPAHSSPVGAQAPVAPQPAEVPGKGGTQRIAGLVLGGVGVIGFGVGTALAFSAKKKFDDGMKQCTGDVCTQQGADLREQAYKGGNVATIVGGLGLVALAAGVVVFLTAPGAKAKAPSETGLVIGPSFVSYKGAF